MQGTSFLLRWWPCSRSLQSYQKRSSQYTFLKKGRKFWCIYRNLLFSKVVLQSIPVILLKTTENDAVVSELITTSCYFYITLGDIRTFQTYIFIWMSF